MWWEERERGVASLRDARYVLIASRNGTHRDGVEAGLADEKKRRKKKL